MSIDPDDDFLKAYGINNNTPQPMWTEQTGTLEVKPKRQRKPWLYKSEHDRIVEEIEMDNVIMLFKGIGIGMIAGLIVGIFGTLIFT
jgi:hypothetical protein